ncbi:MAG: response regulator [Cyanobacteria bacterium P01_F01_bin.56]
MQSSYKIRSKKEILVVDDTPDNLRLLSAILSRKKYEVRKSLNSKNAITSVKADAPDLILLDIKMPEIDGYETCKILKSDPKTQAIPIIFISALDDALDKVRAFEIGGADYISKPFQDAEVLARIENQLHLRDLQLRLEIQNQELIQSNQDLEQFAHIVSHDLQQPLQSIIGYAKILGLQYPELLDTGAGQYLEKILNASNRMNILIKDLLSYATVGKERDALKLVDCNEILAEAIGNLSMLIKEKKANVVYSEMPKVFGRKVQLVQLFQNLMGNSLKFTRPEVIPEINITVSFESESYWMFAFKDNGIGIENDAINMIFQTFQRLHDNDEYPGSGIGLATCKKIVENHSGDIWVESVKGEGSTFFVKFPAAKQHPESA